MTKKLAKPAAHAAHPKKGPRPGSREAEAAERQRKQTAFLAAFAEHATVSAAATAARVRRRTHYDWLETDEEYARRFKDVQETVTEALEAEARRRGQSGVEEPVFYQGRRVDTIRRYSDTLLIFLLKARRPEVYRERYDHNVSGPGSGPVVVRWEGDADGDGKS